jgi:hypothetical protein
MTMANKDRLSWRNAALLLLVCVLIAGWQFAIANRPHTIDPAYGQFSMSGAYHNDHFVYFAYYLGLFPVTSELFIKRVRGPVGPEATSEIPDAYFNAQAARDIVAHHGESLIMDVNAAIMAGARLKTFLYLPKAFLTGSPKNPSYRPLNAAFFVLSLAAVFVFLWRARHRVVAVVAVVLLGSYPFQLVEVYLRPHSIFGWPITSCLALLALNGPILLGENRPRRAAVAAVLSGIWLGTIMHVRFEVVALILSPLLVYAVHPTFTLRRKLALAGLLVGAMLATQLAWNAYTEAKYQQAIQFVRRAGGHPYVGPRRTVHVFWHSVWCGLGDLDTKYGYKWNDLAAYAYAEPILEKKYHIRIPPRDAYYYRETYDAAGKYPKKPEHFDRYNQVLRDKVLSDIARDPLWYAVILAKRVYRVLAEVPPLQLHLGFRTLSARVPAVAWLAQGLLVPLVLIYLRRWDLLKLLAFCAPLTAAPLLIFSKGGMWYPIHHLLSVAIALALVAEWTRARGRGGEQRS